MLQTTRRYGYNGSYKKYGSGYSGYGGDYKKYNDDYWENEWSYTRSLFSSIKENIIDTLRFLWVDLDIEGAIPEDVEVEFIVTEDDKTPSILTSHFTPKNKTKATYSVLLNYKKLKKITMNTNDVKLLMNSQIAYLHNPLSLQILQQITSKNVNMLLKLTPKAYKDKIIDIKAEIIKIAEEVSKDSKYSENLNKFLNGKIIMDGYEKTISDSDLNSIKESIYYLYDNKEDIFSKEEIKNDKEIIEKLYNLFQMVGESPQGLVYSLASFILSLQADKNFLDKFSFSSKLSPKLQELLNKTSTNVITTLLKQHYGIEEKTDLYNNIVDSNKLSEALNLLAIEYSIDDFKQDFENFQKYTELFAFEQHRFKMLQDNTNSDNRGKNKQQIQNAKSGINESKGKKQECGIVGDTKDAKDFAKQNQSKDKSGYEYSDKNSKLETDYENLNKLHNIVKPSMKESTANIHNLEELMWHTKNSAENLKYIRKNTKTQEYEKMKKRIEKIFQFNTKAKITTTQPTKRIAPKNLGLRMTKPNLGIFKKHGKKQFDMKKVNLIVDMSGSMSGSPTKGMRQILLMFNELAQKGLVKGNIILSLPSGGVVYKLPVTEETILTLSPCFGTEGLEKTINKNLKELKKAEYNFCITDAQITDRPLDKKALKRKGIEIVGLYARPMGKTEKEYILENMTKYFDKNSTKETLTQLVEDMIIKLKK